MADAGGSLSLFSFSVAAAVETGAETGAAATAAAITAADADADKRLKKGAYAPLHKKTNQRNYSLSVRFDFIILN